MAAITYNTDRQSDRFRLLESRTLTNLSATDTRRFAIRVPSGARSALFALFIDAMGGTTPTLDFTLSVPDLTDLNSLDDAPLADLGGWNGITQKTAAASPTLTTVAVGEGVTGIADDDTGSATATDHYSVNTVLPPVIVYTVACSGADTDEDYTYRLAVYFR